MSHTGRKQALHQIGQDLQLGSGVTNAGWVREGEDT